MSVYTVSELARMSGISVRTLHHYDQIGLLKPANVGENGYRYYGRVQMLRLQQILFHRELGLGLHEIRLALDAPDFDLKGALRSHRARLMTEARRYRALVKTLDATLAALEGKTEMTDKAMYRGFAPEKQADYEDWLVDRLGAGVRAEIDESKGRMAGMDKAAFDAVMEEIDAIEAEVARAMADALPPDGAAVADIMARHHAWVGRAWSRAPMAEAYSNLADIYVDHPDFRSRYEGRAAGLTEYLAAGMKAYAARALS